MGLIMERRIQHDTLVEGIPAITNKRQLVHENRVHIKKTKKE